MTETVANTRSIIKLRDKDNSIFTTKEFNIIENNGVYSAEINLENLKSDINISIDIEFFDIAKNILVAGIKIENIELNKNDKIFSSKLFIYNQSDINSDILASLTINITENYIGIDGASIFIDDIFIGLTEDNNIGNSGSFKTLIKKGNHTITIKVNDILIATKNIIVNPLDILNIDINIDGNNEYIENNNHNAFKIAVKTDIEIAQDSSFTIGVNSEYIYNYSIDCNDDGVLEAEDLSVEYICNYSDSGEYTVAILGDFPHFYSGDGYSERKIINQKIIKIKQWGDISWKSMKSSFENSSINEIDTLTPPDLSNVTDMSSIFYFADNFNSDISGWDVSNIENMERAFYKAKKFNQNLSEWDVSSVTNMDDMFKNTDSFSNKDLSNWNVLNVTTYDDFNLNGGENNILPNFQ